MGVEANSGLRVLAINILGRFLSNRDNNIRLAFFIYLTLHMILATVENLILELLGLANSWSFFKFEFFKDLIGKIS